MGSDVNERRPLDRPIFEQRADARARARARPRVYKIMSGALPYLHARVEIYRDCASANAFSVAFPPTERRLNFADE